MIMARKIESFRFAQCRLLSLREVSGVSRYEVSKAWNWECRLRMHSKRALKVL